MKIAISLGGSFLFDRPKEVSKLLGELKKLKLDAVIVVGGGKLAREYIDFASNFDLSEKELHEVGILCTRINSKILSYAFNLDYKEGDPRKLKLKKGIIVTGGFLPGWTTDVCTAYAAKSIGAEVIFNLSKERGVYDKDPSKFKDAKLLKKIKFDDLIRISKGKRTPGMNFIFDPLAAKVCKENGIKVIVTNDVLDIRRYIQGEEIKGSIIE